jgi:hypothetical protein
MKKRTYVLLAILSFETFTLIAQEKIAFWDSYPRRGCNYFNEVPTEQWFKDVVSSYPATITNFIAADD